MTSTPNGMYAWVRSLVTENYEVLFYIQGKHTLPKNDEDIFLSPQKN
jgi:hypothetical protein